MKKNKSGMKSSRWYIQESQHDTLEKRGNLELHVFKFKSYYMIFTWLVGLMSLNLDFFKCKIGLLISYQSKEICAVFSILKRKIQEAPIGQYTERNTDSIFYPSTKIIQQRELVKQVVGLNNQIANTKMEYTGTTAGLRHELRMGMSRSQQLIKTALERLNQASKDNLPRNSEVGAGRLEVPCLRRGWCPSAAETHESYE